MTPIPVWELKNQNIEKWNWKFLRSLLEFTEVFMWMAQFEKRKSSTVKKMFSKSEALWILQISSFQLSKCVLMYQANKLMIKGLFSTSFETFPSKPPMEVPKISSPGLSCLSIKFQALILVIYVKVKEKVSTTRFWNFIGLPFKVLKIRYLVVISSLLKCCVSVSTYFTYICP